MVVPVFLAKKWIRQIKLIIYMNFQQQKDHV